MRESEEGKEKKGYVQRGNFARKSVKKEEDPN
jgi:hypothetical protein